MEKILNSLQSFYMDSFSMENMNLGERWILDSMEKEKIRIKQVALDHGR